MNKIFSGFKFLAATTVVSIGNFPLKAIANEIDYRRSPFKVNFNSSNTEIDTNREQYYLADFQLDLEEFCRNYPYNSRCESENISEPELEPEETESAPQQNTNLQEHNRNWAIVANASTLGLGGSIVAKIQPQLNGRVGINAFGFGLEYEETRGSYDADVNLFNVVAAFDYYPFDKSGFHLSLGAGYADNNVVGVASGSSLFDVEVAELNITADELLDVNADLTTSQDFVPYIGIGWGNPVNGNLGFWANLGVMFTGSPQVELSPNYKVNPNLLTAEVRQEIQSSLLEEEQAIEEDLDRFSVYPIVSLGLSYSL
ncbi:hypothetical protein IQ255_18615 [Pleurocapsales cyanobacterium LEGE 10410]|nr:hypothetical protein [Pleurocapsales cyanobacterium LEGE 10410]